MNLNLTELEILKIQLRKKRHQAWIEAAQNSLQGLKPLETCRQWSLAADEILKEAFASCFDTEKYFLIAFGKLGSYELNISSDVDILVVSVDNSDQDWRGPLAKFQSLISERNSYGFCFRVDFDLRPGGRQGSIIPTLDQFEDYYGNYGETWERLALQRCRLISAPTVHQDRLEKFLAKFIWRKHLDFSLMEDLKNLRSKIQGHNPLRPEQGFNLKMHKGGIRDIELFCHALMVIHGGRSPQIRTKGIIASFTNLANAGFVPVEEAEFLKLLYIDLRALENYVQALNDEQTHSIHLTSFNHPPWVLALGKDIQSRCEQSAQIVSDILGESKTELPTEKMKASTEFFGESLCEQSRLDWQEILSTPVLSRNRTRDEKIKEQFLSRFLEILQNSHGHQERAISYLKDFIKATKAKASFFDLFLHNPELLEQLVWLFGHSPYLSGILNSRPEILDSFVYRQQELASNDWEDLLEFLIEKRRLQEILAGADFLRTRTLSALFANCTMVANEVTSSLLDRLKSDIHHDISLVPLGKWGGQEMGLRSDLDFVFVTPNTPNESDYKVAKRFINRITEAHKGGSLYAIDMRLRPSGKAGPLISSEPELIDWLAHEAQAWERQAWLKSKNYQSHCFKRPLDKKDLSELWRIQEALYLNDKSNVSANSEPSTQWSLKYSKGGFIDVELALQTMLLLNQTMPLGTSTHDFFKTLNLEHSVLCSNYSRLRQIEQILQLVSSQSIVNIGRNHECFPQVAEALQLTQDQLQSELQEILEQNLLELNNLDPRRPPQ